MASNSHRVGIKNLPINLKIPIFTKRLVNIKREPVNLERCDLMGIKRKTIDYGVGCDDIFVEPTWPSKFLEDPAYALLRPLYEHTSPWRQHLSDYLYSQARRLGGQRVLLFHFYNLSLISEGYSEFNQFLKTPLDPKLRLKRVFKEMLSFLRWRFDFFSHDPWQDYPVRERLATRRHMHPDDITLTDTERTMYLKRMLSRPAGQKWTPPKDTDIITKALKECPEIGNQANAAFAAHIFSSPVPFIDIQLDDSGYRVCEIPVVLGSHYVGKNVQGVWFEGKGRKFYRILGSYVRWDDAKVVIFKADLANDASLFSKIQYDYGLRSLGNWKRAQVDGEDYYLSLLIDLDLPERSFLVNEWELNCPQLTILTKDTMQ